MRYALGLTIVAVMIASSTLGASAATRHDRHVRHHSSMHHPRTLPLVPYDARGAFGSVAVPAPGMGCDLRPFARDCDKRGPW